ncbi:hypothetical protein [Billgrantia desiderata]|uniref:hypothetical protein n=1 Tax=Billgrantia desiderata TaxID=52021 RepID=UPI003F2DFE3A
MERTSLPWDTQARYRLIEILALWEGRVTASQIGAVFGIGRQQSQKIIRQYRELVPNSLLYDESKKGFVPTEDFRPLFTLGRVEEYLHLQGAGVPICRIEPGSRKYRIATDAQPGDFTSSSKGNRQSRTPGYKA